jgi:hypothetical protein
MSMGAVEVHGRLIIIIIMVLLLQFFLLAFPFFASLNSQEI